MELRDALVQISEIREQMAISFGGGQLLRAMNLYWMLERSDAAQG